jgi:hypothetical protein
MERENKSVMENGLPECLMICVYVTGLVQCI